jgi:HrpA-like RNA helicase
MMHTKLLIFIVRAGKEALIHEIRENAVTIILGETGSGKTTRTSYNMYTTLVYSYKRKSQKFLNIF